MINSSFLTLCLLQPLTSMPIIFYLYYIHQPQMVQSSVLTWLTDTEGVFCFCRVAMMSTNKSIWGGILTSATATVTSEFTAITEWLQQTDNNVLPWRYQESPDCLEYFPLCLTQCSKEDGEREVEENKMTLAGNVKPSRKMGTAFIWPPTTNALNCSQ